MEKIIRFYRSTIGKKYIVAITGLALVFFIIGHVTGNFKTFAGYDAAGVHKLDSYAHFLREILYPVFGHGGFLWVARIGLLVMLVLHVVTVIQLQALNLKANPAKYKGSNYRASTIAARFMMLGGIFLLAFVVFHILHLTIGSVHPKFEDGKVYANVYYAFQNPIVVGFYTLTMVFLGLHLYHGLWSVFQTLGVDNPDLNKTLTIGARFLAIFIVIGFLTVPFAVFGGFLAPPQ
jgi:succinate dehydrogenase / fumarate reductase cytochrome b subunit